MNDQQKKPLKEETSSIRVKNRKMEKFSIASKTGKYTQSLSQAKNLFCIQAISTSKFIIQQAVRGHSNSFKFNC